MAKAPRAGEPRGAEQSMAMGRKNALIGQMDDQTGVQRMHARSAGRGRTRPARLGKSETEPAVFTEHSIVDLALAILEVDAVTGFGEVRLFQIGGVGNAQRANGLLELSEHLADFPVVRRGAGCGRP